MTDIGADELYHELDLITDRNQTVDEVQALYADSDWSRPSDSGNYPIHTIVAQNLPLVEFAMARGAELDVQDGNGSTPLHYALELGNDDMARHLLRLGARVDITDRHGNQAIDAAIFKWGQISNETIDLILAAGGDPDRPNRIGVTARSRAAERKKLYHPTLSPPENKPS